MTKEDIKEILNRLPQEPEMEDLEKATTEIFALFKQDSDGWISVKERLPEENTKVLVSLTQNDDAHYAHYVNGEFEIYFSSGSSIKFVHSYGELSHWRELPAPPTGKESDK